MNRHHTKLPKLIKIIKETHAQTKQKKKNEFNFRDHHHRTDAIHHAQITMALVLNGLKKKNVLLQFE